MVTFRAPSESATASTTELVIDFPRDQPFASAAVQPKPGWTGTVVKKALSETVTSAGGGRSSQYVAQVDYKATSAASAIPPGQFDLFNIQVSPFPKKPSVSFSVLQVYSDGTKVRWNERSAGGVTPEHPAPTLRLDPAAGPATAAAASPAAGGSRGASSWPGAAALVAAVLALLASGAALLGVRHRGAPAPDRPGTDRA